jgi:Cu-processing system ATP-binding protein
VIRFRGFTKRFGDHVAVEALTLEVGAGEVVALLGPNGSGKTTSLKAAAGLILPDAGEALVGEPPRCPSEPAARRACSYLPQKVSSRNP